MLSRVPDTSFADQNHYVASALNRWSIEIAPRFYSRILWRPRQPAPCHFWEPHPPLSAIKLPSIPTAFNPLRLPFSPSGLTTDYLTFTINADQGTTISKIDFSMSGDTTPTGIPASYASSGISSNVFIQVTQVNGSTSTNVSTTANLVFNPDDGLYSLASNGNIIGQIVNGTAEIDVNALLATNNVTGSATSVNVTLSTNLNTNASTNGSAFISVKQADVNVISAEPGEIGEPSTKITTATVFRILGNPVLLASPSLSRIPKRMSPLRW